MKTLKRIIEERLGKFKEKGISEFTEKFVMEFDSPKNTKYILVLNFNHHQITIDSNETQTKIYDSITGVEHETGEVVPLETVLSIVYHAFEKALVE